MRVGKISSYLTHDLVPTPDDSGFVFLYKLAADNVVYGKKSDGSYFAVGGSSDAVWGGITGAITDQADLQDALALKADLIAGVVPANQLPSYVDDVLNGTYINSTTFNDTLGVPYTPELGKIYIDTTTGHSYRWTGSIYFDFSTGNIGNGTQNYLPQILATASGKIISFGNSVVSDDGNIFTIALGAGGQLAGVRSSGALGIFSNTSESHISVGGSTSPGGGYTRIHSTIANFITGSVLNFAYVPAIAAGKMAVFNNASELVSQDVVIPFTYSEAVTLSNNSLIVSGQQYLITDSSIIDLGVVVVGSPNPKKFQTDALGGFLNADYQNVGDYDTIESITGFAKGTFQGVWRAENEVSFANGDIVIQSNVIYQVIDSSLFNSLGPSSNPTAYYAFTRANFLTEQVGYIQEWDSIEYDFSNDIPTWRFDKRNNIINFQSLSSFQFGNDMVEWQQGDSECVISCSNNIGEIIGFQNLGSNVNAEFNEGTINECSYSKGSFTINLNSGVYHSYCSCSIKEEIQFLATSNHLGKTLKEYFSTFEENLVITSSNIIDLDTIRYAGIVNLLSENASESIEHITCYLNTKVKFLNKIVNSYIACDITFLNQTDNIFINTRDKTGEGNNFLLNRSASKQSFAEFNLSNELSSAYLINGCNYLA